MTGNRHGEAFTGESSGCVLSSEITPLRRPTLLCQGEGNPGAPGPNVNGNFEVTRTESQTTGMNGNFSHGNREIPDTSVSPERDRSKKARRHNADMHVSGKFT